MIVRTTLALSLLVAAGLACGKGKKEPREEPRASPPREVVAMVKTDANPVVRAAELAQKTLLIDGHIDLPYRLRESRNPDGSLSEDVSQHTEKGHFDYVRARAGGLDAAFMAIYIPADLQKKPGAGKQLADELIDMVEAIVADHPDKFTIVRSPAEVKQQFGSGKFAVALGIENGAAIETDLANLRHFYERGIRYVTLAHSEDNAICDSSYSDKHTNEGLSKFGKQVIGEMNRLGLMIDISHVTDATFYQVVELSKAPVIASHSSMRKFTPGFERNMDDAMVKRLAEVGGVVMVNFGSWFLDAAFQKQEKQREKLGRAYGDKHGLSWDKHAEREQILKHVDLPLLPTTIAQVADHIDHVVALAGIDHVGLGSDYDGVRALPVGLEDVAAYPNLIRLLLERGYDHEQLTKLCSGNTLRVWSAVAAAAEG